MSVNTMEMASHGPATLSRTHTAPVHLNLSNMNSQFPSGIGQQTRSSQLSGATAVSNASFASLTSLSTSQTLVPPTPGTVIATNNIINQRADASRSLYQICVALRNRLRDVPGFDEFYADFEIGDRLEHHDEGDDPVSQLWRSFRKGYPLLLIYNTIRPEKQLAFEENTSEKNRAKAAASKFIMGCMGELKLPPAKCFQLGELFGDDTTGFVNVTTVINGVLDVAEERGYLSTKRLSAETPGEPGSKAKMSYRDHVVQELVDTERKYVQDLENLHELKKTIEQTGVVNGDVVHQIFLNINAILDFQRRFLIRVEGTINQADANQCWGAPFVQYEAAFDIYQPFIANQRKAAATAMREFDKIHLANHPVCVDFNTLDGFLLKPMQRLVKYPLLLKDLRDKTGADEETKADLQRGIDAANRVLKSANDAVDRELRDEALADLCSRVDDWKSHDINHFGDLLLHGQFTVLTGKSDVEKEFSIYLFERILLCCKELNPNKAAKDKLLSGPKKERKDKDKKTPKDKNSKPGKLQLKGRIFMTNVSDVISLVKPGTYTVQIWWKGDPGVENFIIRFKNEETMKKWSQSVSKQRQICNDRDAELVSAGAVDSQPANFAWMRDQSIANPYVNHEDEDDDDYDASPKSYTAQASYPQSLNIPRNASSTSLRSRSTTAESQHSTASTARGPPRFPNPFPPTGPLSVQTNGILQQAQSPGTRGGDSYFSPVAESPASSRTSQNSSMYPFPRQSTPQNGWEEHNRYTAPPMAKVSSRDGSQPPPNGYQTNGRNPQRPSLPAMASNSSQAAANAQQRNRAHSTNDINGPQGTNRRLPNGQLGQMPQMPQMPTVPSIPNHLAYEGGIPRSNSNSPGNASLAIRSNTQSPTGVRERLLQNPAFPVAPNQYSRSNPAQSSNFGTMDSRTVTPIPDMPAPTQLKVKVKIDDNYITLVVNFNITYQSLVDRIDAKVGRFSTNAIARGTISLCYVDEDGDKINIGSDEDVQMALFEWKEAASRESARNAGQIASLGEIELICVMKS